tara:strand:+ start:714 stop:1382 length:669 start_codon:yes stop_codon:yes gene_type:complete
MEAIETELSNKIVEKPREGAVQEVITDVEEKHPEPVKKPRSEAQKKAFEKARAKRMENLEKKKKVEVKPEPTEVKEVEGQDVDISNFETPPKKKRGRPKGSKSKKVIKHQEPAPTPQTPNYPQPVQHQIPQPAPPQYPVQGQIPLNPYQHYYHPPPPPQPQAPVNNYYYYGTPPPQQSNNVVAEEPSSEEEQVEEFEQEEEQFQSVPLRQPEPPTRLMYRFA